METLLNPPVPPQSSKYVRTFDPGRDLNPVADLVELCFANTLDADGHRYLNQMRQAARNPNLVRIANRLGDLNAFPMAGFVWDQSGRVVGNLSLIPFQKQRQRVYLIANVAVHPDFRRRGIAKALTRAALSRLKQNGADFPWLQVREDNPTALHLYTSLGFKEEIRRTTWHSEIGDRPNTPPTPGVSIVPLASRHRRAQQRWLAEVYPPIIDWHLPFKRRDLRPDLFGFLLRLFSGVFVRQFAAVEQGRLLGTAAWQATHGHYNALWLGADPQAEDTAAHALMHHLKTSYGTRRALALEYPAGRAEAGLQASGFTPHQVLIWMRGTRWD